MRTAEVKYKITHDLVLDLYEKSKTKEGEERRRLVKKAEFFSKHIGCYLAKVNSILEEKETTNE